MRLATKKTPHPRAHPPSYTKYGTPLILELVVTGKFPGVLLPLLEGVQTPPIYTTGKGGDIVKPKYRYSHELNYDLVLVFVLTNFEKSAKFRKKLKIL